LSVRQVFKATVVGLRSYDAFDADILLGFGVRLRRRVVVEGIVLRKYTREQLPSLYRALTLVLAGKRVLLLADPSQQQEIIRAAVYYDEREPAGGVWIEDVPGYGRRMNVGLFVSAMAPGFNLADVRGLLNNRAEVA